MKCKKEWMHYLNNLEKNSKLSLTKNRKVITFVKENHNSIH